jgi:CRP-like cAMP-binding protein
MPSVALLKESDIFQDLNDAQLEKLVAIAKEELYPTGTLLYKEGDPSAQLYLIQQGKVFLEMKSDMGPTRPPI